MTDDDLTGYVVEGVSVLVDDLSGDVGLRIDGGDSILILTADLAEELGRDLLAATRRDHRSLTPAQWCAK